MEHEPVVQLDRPPGRGRCRRTSAPRTRRGRTGSRPGRRTASAPPTHAAKRSARFCCASVRRAGRAAPRITKRDEDPKWLLTIAETAAAAAIAPIHARSRGQAARGSSAAGRRMAHASTRTSGYSTIPVNTTGATSALNSPPSMPPSDTQKKNSVRRAGPGRSLARSPWQASAAMREDQQVQRQDERHRLVHLRDQHQRQDEDPERHEPRRQRARRRCRRAEGDDERRQIDAERHHPQQRHRGDVGGHVARDGEQQAGRHEREQRPAGAARPRCDRLRVRAGARHRSSRRPDPGRASHSLVRLPPPHGRRADEREQRQQRVARRPDLRLLLEPERALHEQRVGEQPGEAAHVAGGVEEVRIARPRGVGRRVPFLQDAGARRQREERQADRGEQREQEPADGIALGRRALPPASAMGSRSSGAATRATCRIDCRRAPRSVVAACAYP